MWQRSCWVLCVGMAMLLMSCGGNEETITHPPLHFTSDEIVHQVLLRMSPFSGQFDVYHETAVDLSVYLPVEDTARDSLQEQVTALAVLIAAESDLTLIYDNLFDAARALLDISDANKCVIRELPEGYNTFADIELVDNGWRGTEVVYTGLYAEIHEKCWGAFERLKSQIRVAAIEIIGAELEVWDACRDYADTIPRNWIRERVSGEGKEIFDNLTEARSALHRGLSTEYERRFAVYSGLEREHADYWASIFDRWVGGRTPRSHYRSC